MKYKYLFGPVLSRRLGISLGVDLIPYKTCTLNCIYCECGATTTFQSKRKAWLPSKKIISELTHYLTQKPILDYITFSGAGEPTLASNIGTIIAWIKKNHPEYKIAVITNGNLLNQKKVQSDLSQADVIIPSLDTATEKTFQIINQPHKNLTAKKQIKGLINFRNKIPIKYWLEIFLIKGLNDTPNEIKALQKAVKQIQPDKIQLNVMDRPGIQKDIQTPDEASLQKIASQFAPIPTEITQKKTQPPPQKINTYSPEYILKNIPSTPTPFTSLRAKFSIHANDLEKILTSLKNDGKITQTYQNNTVCYSKIANAL